MKKTVTTILSLALALILVSSLGSGVILAKGDDYHDNRKKNKNKYETVREVSILSCVGVVGPGVPLTFSTFDGPMDVAMLLPPMPGSSCAAAEAIVFNEGWKLKDLFTGINVSPPAVVRLSTFVRKTRVKIVED